MDNDTQPRQGVLVTTSARLHLGFFDLNGQIGRRFGSLGLSLQEPVTQIALALLPADSPQPARPGYIESSLQKLLAFTGIKQAVAINVMSEIPRHAGLGSGTQMALAIGAGLNRLLNLNVSLSEIASVTGRGLRSGIGIGTFASGGLVLDGGRGPNTVVPPIIAQYDFPADWRILLLFDDHNMGTHGAQEQAAFAALENASADATARNCQQLLMQVLPAVQERDFHTFSAAIAQLQAYTGSYFCAAQGGLYASAAVAKALGWLTAQGHTGVGQTSWGPTGFALFENAAIAEQTLQQMQNLLAELGLRGRICQAKNSGASIDTTGLIASKPQSQLNNC